MTDGSELASEPGCLAKVLAIEPDGPDRFVARSIRQPWPNVYGGQLVAQAVVAAARVADAPAVLSVHAAFLRGARTDLVTTIAVRRPAGPADDVEVRRVELSQAGRTVLHADVALGSPDLLERPAPAAGRGDLDDPPDPGAGPPVTGFAGSLDVRTARPDDPSVAEAWVRPVGPLPLDDATRGAVLAYTTDVITADPVMRVQPGAPVGPPWPLDAWLSVSLDHHIWFHRLPDPTAWHRTRLRCAGIAGGRGLATGVVCAADGTPVASIAQEHLVRRRAPQTATA